MTYPALLYNNKELLQKFFQTAHKFSFPAAIVSGTRKTMAWCGRNGDALSRIVALLVSLAGLMVMTGWVLNIEILKSILPRWVTMKFTTALSFTLSGIMLYSLSMASEKRPFMLYLLIPVSVLSLFLIMATLLASSLLNVYTGIENLLVREGPDAVMTTLPGRPSVGTMAGFLLTAIAGILTIYRPGAYNRLITQLGIAVCAVGGTAIAGYIMDSPFLFYMYEGRSTAMAVHTAVLFMMLGAGLMLKGKSQGSRHGNGN